eukprot:5689580-Amphidinium_carterae.1
MVQSNLFRFKAASPLPIIDENKGKFAETERWGLLYPAQTRSAGRLSRRKQWEFLLCQKIRNHQWENAGQPDAIGVEQSPLEDAPMKKRRAKHHVPRAAQIWSLNWSDFMKKKHIWTISRCLAHAKEWTPEVFDIDADTPRRWPKGTNTEKEENRGRKRKYSSEQGQELSFKEHSMLAEGFPIISSLSTFMHNICHFQILSTPLTQRMAGPPWVEQTDERT